jgi:DNA-binding NtrC family response regulator
MSTNARHQTDLVTPGRVLIIDDQPEVRRVLGAILRRSGGYSVTEVGDAQGALDIIKREECELVVSDVHMPGMDGVELLKILREQDPDLPVLLMSGNPDLDTAMKAVEYKAFEYLMKPVDNDKLLASVERALSARREQEKSKRELDQYRSGTRARSMTGRGYGRHWTGESWVAATD